MFVMKSIIENVLIIFIGISLQAQSYGVTIDVDTSNAPQLVGFANKSKQRMLAWYPIINDDLSSPNFTPPSNIRIVFAENLRFAAVTSGSKITCNIQYYKNNPDDIGSMVHEMTHVIQSYKNCPFWITEGIADWIRYYKYEPSRRMPTKPGPKDSYTSGYSTAAYFLQYIIDNTPQWRAPQHMVYWANKDCREGNYNDSMWPRMTGKTLDQHWQDMLKSTVRVPPASTRFGCYKQNCRSWCSQRDSGNWCYTTQGRKDDKGMIKCNSPSDCNENWQCGSVCNAKGITK